MSGGLRIVSAKLDKKTADPALVEEGELWYNITAKRYKVFRDGVVRELIDRQEFLDHVNNTSNPHNTTLEEARVADNQLLGDVLLDGNLIVENDNTIVPDVNGTGSIGTDTLRFKTIAAKEVISGDLVLYDEEKGARWRFIEETDGIRVVNEVTGQQYEMVLAPTDREE